MRLHWPYVAMSASHRFFILFEMQIFATPLAKYGDFDFRKLQKGQPVPAKCDYYECFYVFFDRATKSLTRSGYPFCEQNCTGEPPLFTARLGVTKPHFDYGKPMLPHAAGPRARRILPVHFRVALNMIRIISNLHPKCRF